MSRLTFTPVVVQQFAPAETPQAGWARMKTGPDSRLWLALAVMFSMHHGCDVNAVYTQQPFIEELVECGHISRFEMECLIVGIKEDNKESDL